VNAGIKGREERGAANGRELGGEHGTQWRWTRVGKEARTGEERGVSLSGCWPDEERRWVGTIRVLVS